jgi:hypothetical protein
MSKGIATQTILLLLVGILVVGILIYMVYRTVMNPQISEEECKARWISQCVMCKNANWENTAAPPSSLLADCTKGAFLGWKDNTDCTEAKGSMRSECKQLGIE